MIRTRTALRLPILLLPSLLLAAAYAAPARDLRWPELIPAHLSETPVVTPQVDHSGFGDMTQLSPWGDIAMSELLVPDLDGEQVTIAGFVVPLNLTEDKHVDEFLLVPYFGACVHVPPPPANQVIHVTASPGLDIERVYEAWTVTGVLRVDAKETAMASAGYSLAATAIRLYGS